MKCGEIWARSARSSACASRSSCAASARQLDLGGDEAGDLAHHARVLRPQPSLRAVERGEPADPLAADDQRRDHRVPVRVRPALDRDALGVRQPVAARRRQPVRGQHVAAVVDQHPAACVSACRCPIALPADSRVSPLRRCGSVAAAACSAERTPSSPGASTRRGAREPAERDHRGGEHHAEQHTEQDVHAASIRRPMRPASGAGGSSTRRRPCPRTRVGRRGRRAGRPVEVPRHRVPRAAARTHALPSCV